MHENDKTHLSHNVKRVDIGTIVTVANTSIDKRQHYYISNGEDTHPSAFTYDKVDVVTANDPISKVLIGKMVGDKVFFRHNLMIEFIEWPSVERMIRK